MEEWVEWVSREGGRTAAVAGGGRGMEDWHERVRELLRLAQVRIGA
jgi:hypothetical protein